MIDGATLRRVGIGLSVAIALGAPARGQTSGPALACLPDVPSAVPGETVGVNVWATGTDGAPLTRLRVIWDSEIGQIDQSAASARWTLAGAAIDRRYTATAQVEIDGMPMGSCSFGVWVVSPVAPGALGDIRPRGEFIARRAFLRPGDFGEAGFGLYSYFLMRAPEDARARQRQARVVQAFLDLMSAVSEQENYVERSRLNGSYLPVTMQPPPGLEVRRLTEWILEHYDYERAKAFLSFYPVLTGAGPFVVAVPRPLRGPVTPLLTWDLGGLDDERLADGVGRFLNQSAQLYDWGRGNALEAFRDRLLTSVAGMFVGRATAEAWIQLGR